jgi:hypothetical protein
MEITGFPLSGLQESSKKYYLLLNYFLEAEKKGWISQCGAPAMVESYFEYIKHLPSKFRKKLGGKSLVLESVLKIVHGAENAGELLSNSFRVLGYQHTVSDFVARNVLENIAVELFAEVNPSTNFLDKVMDNKISIVRIPHKLTMYVNVELRDDPRHGITEQTRKKAMEFVKALPVYDVMSNIEYSFHNLSKQAEGYSNQGT